MPQHHRNTTATPQHHRNNTPPQQHSSNKTTQQHTHNATKTATHQHHTVIDELPQGHAPSPSASGIDEERHKARRLAWPHTIALRTSHFALCSTERHW
jgi:hypothetical protein